jgi:ABC-type bacteriocin/lantibiotic exporter with double-glycine peptidase domain
MSDGVLPLNYHKQEHPTTCIPACVRMVLEFQGLVLSEEALIDALGFRLDPPGLEEAIRNACKVYGAAGKLEYGTRHDLARVAVSEMPLITSMNVEGLDWGSSYPGFKHCVVVIGLDGDDVLFLDPWTGAYPSRLKTAEFCRHWWGNRMVRLRLP